jgi:O-antigen ligase
VSAATLVLLALGTGALSPILASRANLDSSGRSGAAGASWELVTEQPLTGTGVGEATLVWSGPGGFPAIAKYAHNEYLQILVDLGAVGLALLLGLIAAVVVAIRRARPTGQPDIRSGAIAALVAFAVHSAFDFLWHIPVLPLLAAILVALAIGTVPVGQSPDGEPVKTGQGMPGTAD